MKAFIVLLLCGSALVHAKADISTFEQRVEQYRNECRHELNLDPGLMNDKDSEIKRPSIQEHNCFVACMDKKLGIMSQDGIYDKKALVNMVTAEEGDVESRIEEYIQNCKSQVGNDHCRMAACINQEPPINRMPPSNWQ